MASNIPSLTIMTVRFYLDRPSSTTPTSVLISIHLGDGSRLKKGVDISIAPRHWNTGKGRAKKGYRHEAAINNRLNVIESSVVTEFLRLLNAGVQPTREHLQAKLSTTTPSASPAIPDVLTALDHFIESSATTLRPRTLLIYKTVGAHLRAFSTAYGISLDWAAVNMLFFQKFVEYLVRVQGNNNTTLDKTVQRLRAFLRHCDEVLGIPMCRDYTRFTKKVFPKGEQSRKAYITRDELAVLERLDLAGGERLVRDLFLFLAHTGLRYGDSQTLRSEHVVGDCLHITTGKNRKTVTVPLHPTAMRIWEMYEGRLPRMSNQHFNTSLKGVCRLAEIDTACVVVDFSGATRRERVVPKWALVGAHTAKRSFVTNLLLSGVSLESICEITGNTRNTIQQYIVPTGEDVRREIMVAWS